MWYFLAFLIFSLPVTAHAVICADSDSSSEYDARGHIAVGSNIRAWDASYGWRWYKINSQYSDAPADNRSSCPAGNPTYHGQLSPPRVIFYSGCGTDEYPYGNGWRVSYTVTLLGTSTPSDCGSCSDGVQNQDETGIDCGGVCGSCEPSTCSDGVKSGDEPGIDCGGSCSAPCTEYCPDGYAVGLDSNNQNICVSITSPDAYGNCPAGWEKAFDGNCESSAELLYGVANLNTNELGSLPSGWYQLPDSYTPGNFSVAEFTGPTSVVDNGDGTQTATTVTTSSATSPTGSAPATSTTTRTVITNISTGAVISDQTTTQTEGPVEENPANYKWSVADPGSTGDIPDGIVPTENPFSDFLDSTVSSNPGSTIINSSGLETSNPVCSLSGVVMGQSLTIDFCRPLISDALEMMGAVLVSICYLLAIFIVFA